MTIEEKKIEDNYTFNLVMSLIFAVLSGFISTFNQFTIQWAIQTGGDVD